MILYSPKPDCVVGWAPKDVFAFWNKLVGWDCVDGNNDAPVGWPNADVVVLPNPVAGFPKSWDWPKGLALAAVAVPNPSQRLKHDFL